MVPGLRLSVDGTRIRKRDNIASLPLQRIIDNEGFLDGRVTRAAATPANDPKGYGVGPIVGVNSTLVNLSRTEIDAMDIAARYQVAAGRYGAGIFSINGTRLYRFRDQVSPTVAFADSLGLVTNLKWVATASVTWNYRNWTAGWQAEYYSKYWLTLTHAMDPDQGAATIPSQIYNDLFASFKGSRSSNWSLMNDVSIQVGVKNIFNRSPPIVVASTYSSLGDPRLARYYLNLQKSFD